MHRSTPPSAPTLPLSSLLNLGGPLPDLSDPVGPAVRSFFSNNWRSAREGLLARTTVVRVTPLPPEGPRVFCFEIDRPYKRKLASGQVVLDEGPIEGLISYQSTVLNPPAGVHPILVFVTSEGFYHPNFGRQHSVLCLGDLPRGPFPLDALVEHVYGIVTYQNVDVHHALDREAASYFARDPLAFEGLDDVPTLY
jgi:hypothetical protein